MKQAEERFSEKEREANTVSLSEKKLLDLKGEHEEEIKRLEVCAYIHTIHLSLNACKKVLRLSHDCIFVLYVYAAFYYMYIHPCI